MLDSRGLERGEFRGWQGSLAYPCHQLCLALRELSAERVHVEAGFLRLRKDAFHPLFLFPDMVLNLLAENLDFGIIKLVVRTAMLNLGNEHLGPIMLDISLLEHVSLDLALTRGVENFLLDLRVNRQRLAD